MTYWYDIRDPADPLPLPEGRGAVAFEGVDFHYTNRPDHPVLRRPNRISELDWEGWVQERGLYFARTWDRRFRPVLETHDPGEPPLRGGLLIAPLGKGTYVYTGLSFFRQCEPATQLLREILAGSFVGGQARANLHRLLFGDLPLRKSEKGGVTIPAIASGDRSFMDFSQARKR